ncbi:hypothetical protein HPP92_024243 [Vanilla planifolia]|uniref:Uncharacterized protein n=1 Tax=Vanilla planifolia TaxID=51239 RepID=A0A835PMJ0_VANPL|nr:hypothetical protein HPP92_024243 [Vanilla planifolia]
MTLKRKKWTEEEERSLIDKYADMQADGILDRMRTREKKFRPIATHVNAEHHSLDPASYPFLWSWKDACTKVQNMRHQYLLVKQKVISSSAAADGVGEPDWSEGLSLWPNFLRYRHVFGDAPLPPKPPDPPPSLEPLPTDGVLCLGLGFDCSDEDGGFGYEEATQVAAIATTPPPPPSQMPSERRKKKDKRRRREGREWGKVFAAITELREREERLEERERERARRAEEKEERDRERREAEIGDRMRRLQDDERDWEERMEQRRVEWRKKMEAMIGQHRAEMEQIQARVLHEQHNVVNHLVEIISHWAAGGGSGGIPDVGVMGGGGGAATQHYVSQMMQGMHHVNGMLSGENRVGDDGPEDQFIGDE